MRSSSSLVSYDVSCSFNKSGLPLWIYIGCMFICVCICVFICAFAAVLIIF